MASTTGADAGSGFRYFYFLFLPVLWAAPRQGLYGTALLVFLLQMAIIALARLMGKLGIDNVADLVRISMLAGEH